MKEVSECLTCGSKEVSNISVRYFVVPGHIMVTNSYLLCEKHKGLKYYFDDIYDENSKRKTIDHEAVKKRNIPKTVHFNMEPRNVDEIKIVSCYHQWIRVKDRLPDKGQCVLVIADNSHSNGSMNIISVIYDNKRWVVDHFCEYSFIDEPTHWMPLPETPK